MPPQRTLPNLQNASLHELQTAMRCAPTQRTFLKLQSIEQFYKGFDFNDVLTLCGKSERSLQRVVADWNRAGIDGLIEKPRPGRRPKIAGEQAAAVIDLLEHPAKAGHHHWTARKLHGHLRRELALEVGYSTLTRFLRGQRYRLKFPRPMPVLADPAARQEFCERLVAHLENEGTEVWFQDESGFEGDPRPRRRWVKIGAAATVPRNGWHLRMNASGVVCPRTGEAFFCEFSHSDTASFQAFLDEANRHVSLERGRNIMVLDNASWHKAKGINWGRFEPQYLPAYSPDLNPIERLWQSIKQTHFTDFIAKSKEDLVEHLDKALLWAMERPQETAKTCAIATKL